MKIRHRLRVVLTKVVYDSHMSDLDRKVQKAILTKDGNWNENK